MPVLGQKSLSLLQGVHPLLVSVVHRAIEITPIDFCVGEGLRSLERQQKLVAAGSSKTLDSMHRVQPDGYGHAVDLWAMIDGQVEWKMGLYYVLAQTIRNVAIEQGTPLTWGCVWDRDIRDLTEGADELDDDVAAYGERRRALGKKPFADGPHFELRL